MAARSTILSPTASPGPSFDAIERTNGPPGSYWYAHRTAEINAPTMPTDTETTLSGLRVWPELW